MNANYEYSIATQQSLTDFQGRFLNLLWHKPAEARARGAPVKAGKSQIQAKAKIILAKAKDVSNPVAEALNLGPCMIVEPTDKHRTSNRPFEKLSAAIGHRKHTGHNCLSYHITWVAENGEIPRVEGGAEYSHQCHQKWCVNPKHGQWENGAANKRRNICADGRSHFLLDNGGIRHLVKICTHQPECLSGTLVQDMDHPDITKV
jgi:hypothetical protein